MLSFKVGAVWGHDLIFRADQSNKIPDLWQEWALWGDQAKSSWGKHGLREAARGSYIGSLSASFGRRNSTSPHRAASGAAGQRLSRRRQIVAAGSTTCSPPPCAWGQGRGTRIWSPRPRAPPQGQPPSWGRSSVWKRWGSGWESSRLCSTKFTRGWVWVWSERSRRCWVGPGSDPSRASSTIEGKTTDLLCKINLNSKPWFRLQFKSKPVETGNSKFPQYLCRKLTHSQGWKCDSKDLIIPA